MSTTEQIEEKLEDEECEPCKVGVLIGITHQVCEQSVSGDEKRKECEVLYEDVVMGKITVEDFITKVQEKVTEPLDRKTLEGVLSVAKEYNMTKAVLEVTSTDDGEAASPAQPSG